MHPETVKVGNLIISINRIAYAGKEEDRVWIWFTNDVEDILLTGAEARAFWRFYTTIAPYNLDPDIEQEKERDHA